jgi:hypothetical protein
MYVSVCVCIDIDWRTEVGGHPAGSFTHSKASVVAIGTLPMGDPVGWALQAKMQSRYLQPVSFESRPHDPPRDHS